MPLGKAAFSLLIASLALGGCVNSQTTQGGSSYGFADGTQAVMPVPRPVSTGAGQIAAEIPAPDYVVEFRARPGPDIIGHSYLVYGIEGDDGRIVDAVQVGLYPKDMSGFAVGVGGMAEATTEPVEYDLSIKPNAVYRHKLTPEQYARLDAAVRAARANPPRWNWTQYNCNTFVADMAKAAGLKTPYGSTLLAPAAFVLRMEALNGDA